MEKSISNSNSNVNYVTAVTSTTVTVVTTCCITLGLSLLTLRHILLPTLQSRAKTFFINILNDADITVTTEKENENNENGNNNCENDVSEMIVKDDTIFLEWMQHGMLAIGESYMASQWTINSKTTSLDKVLTKLMLLSPDKKRKLMKSWNAKFVGLAARVFNYQSPSRAGIVGAHHYDLGNDFFELWLDPNMQYSCGYWKKASNLEQAQIEKLHLIAKKLHLKPGMTVLEIGCGWGGLACFFAKHYQVHVTGITISNEQLKGAREWAKRDGVTDLTSFEYCDYRKMNGQFDRVVSIAMLEAVGYKNMNEYYQVISRCLKPTGLSLVHSICANRSTKTAHQRWILKYIFPNGFLPTVAQMCTFSEKKGLVVEDVHNLGPDYDNTLMAWKDGFEKHLANGKIQKSTVFINMWDFYLCYCAAGFRARTIQLNQVVYSKKRSGRFDTVR